MCNLQKFESRLKFAVPVLLPPEPKNLHIFDEGAVDAVLDAVSACKQRVCCLSSLSHALSSLTPAVCLQLNKVAAATVTKRPLARRARPYTCFEGQAGSGKQPALPHRCSAC